jgi:hypothetical protein
MVSFKHIGQLHKAHIVERRRSVFERVRIARKRITVVAGENIANPARVGYYEIRVKTRGAWRFYIWFTVWRN